MSKQPSRTNGIGLVFSRPSDFSREAEWDAWYDDIHLPETVHGSGAWVATRWETIGRPPLFSTPVGFTHLAIYEFDDVATGGPALLDLIEKQQADGALHPMHTVLAADVLVPEGAWSGRLEPRQACAGQVIAYVAPNTDAILDEWNTWYDEIHVPDMMGSGAFADTTRWVRTDPDRFGPNHLTIYDVEIPDVGEAVLLSGTAMGPAQAAGRLMDRHAGGLRSALTQAGRYGGRGYRADD